MLDRVLLHIFSEASAAGARRFGAAFTSRQWAQLAVGSLLCFACTGGIARLAGVPAEPGFGGSVLAGPAPVLALAVVAVSLVVGTVIGGVIAGGLGVEAALLCVAVGLTALAVRCGPVRPVLQAAAGRGVFVAMAVETAVLGGLLVGAYVALTRAVAASRAERLPLPKPVLVGNEAEHPTLQQKVSATGVAVLVMAACEMVFVQTDTKGQALGGTAVAAFAGAWAAYWFMPLAEGVWYWVAPAVLGVIGYLLAAASGEGLAVGEVHGWGAALARPTPLDYASLAVAFALLGQWSGRRLAQDDDVPAAEPEVVRVAA